MKASPSTKAAILKRVADYERHGKLPKPGEHLGVATLDNLSFILAWRTLVKFYLLSSGLHSGLEDTSETLFALGEGGQSGLHPGLDDTGEDLFALREGGQSGLHPGLDETVEALFALGEGGQSDLHPGVEDTGEALFALSESGQSDLHPSLEDTGEALFALGEGGRSGLHSGVEDTGETFFALREVACHWNNEHTLPTSVTSDFSDVPVTPFHFGSDSGKSALVDPPSSGLALSNNFSVLDRVLAVPTDAAARCAKVAGGVVDPDLRVAPRSTMGKSAVLDCGATKRIFDSTKVFTEDDDGDHFGDNFDDSIPDLDSGSDSHEDDDPEAFQRGVNAFATFTCKLIKMVHVVPMTYNDSSAKVVVGLFMDAVWRLHGAPMKIVCDRDPRFRDAMTQEFMRLMGVKAASTTPYHPQSDGQAERNHHTMERMLRCYVAENQEDWDLWVTPVEYAINDSTSAATGFSPFELVYGHAPATQLDFFMDATLEGGSRRRKGG
eukprot:gene25557-biopygen26442